MEKTAVEKEKGGKVMTREEIRGRALFFMGAEEGDAAEYAPHLDALIETGYGNLCLAAGKEWPENSGDGQVLDLPLWAQEAVAEYAASRMLQNGGADRRERAGILYARYMQASSRLLMREGKRVKFIHLYD